MPAPSTDALPAMRCPRRSLGPLEADPTLAPWPELAPTPFLETVSGQPPRQATWVKTAWDAHELRVLFRVEDTHVWATLTEPGALLYEEEVVEVFLDPVGDLAAYFEIELNPLNAVLDLVLRRDGAGYRKDFQWACKGLRTAASRDAAGWCGEFSIPFASLGVQGPPQRWRANFHRIDRPVGAPRELSSWSPTGAADFHVPQRFGILEFGVT